LTFALGEQVQLWRGDFTIQLHFERAAPAVEAPPLAERDYGFLKLLVACFMVFGALMWCSSILNAYGLTTPSDDLFSNQAKYVKLLVVAPQEPKRIKDLSGIREGAKAAGAEGKIGKAEATKAAAEPSKSTSTDRSAANQRKVNSVMSGLFGGGAASTVFGSGGLGSGINNALGGLTGGAGVGDAQGIGGLGARGSSSGGGGAGLGVGGLGTKGLGQGSGGYGTSDLGGKGKETTRIIPGNVTVAGGLDRAEVLKVIQRHASEIKFCYEQSLQKSPGLAGKVSMAWTIEASGTVQEANVAESSIGSAEVEKCMSERIRRWKFPEPRGGGVVDITFPWNFKPAGDTTE
jgi:TonB family protein